MEKILVKLSGNSLSFTDPFQIGGSVVVCGEEPTSVYPTKFILNGIKEGSIVETESPLKTDFPQKTKGEK